ncbi:MAG TPA: hypothetical protein VG411_02600, partial [Actinomycetota bacterium]|nr:hypothetical protein [Actinomycetota bacterium]
RPEPSSPPRSWRRPTGHKPQPGNRPHVPSAPRPGKPLTADPDGGSSCPGGPRGDVGRDRPGRDHHRRPGADSGRWVEPRRDKDHRDGRGRDEDRRDARRWGEAQLDEGSRDEDHRGRDMEAGDPGAQGRGHDERERRADPDERASRDVKVTGR